MVMGTYFGSRYRHIDHDGDLDAVTSHGGHPIPTWYLTEPRNGTFVESFALRPQVYAPMEAGDSRRRGTLDLLS